MPQVLKDEVRTRVREAALETFAERGYVGATMAAVAERADVATANLYRYYRGKEELFHDVISDEFVEQFEEVVGRRALSFGTLVATDEVERGVADEMMAFWLANRLRAVVVLARSDGTRHEGAVRRLTDLSVETLVDALPPGAVGDADRELLDSIFVNTARTIARILEHNTTEVSIRSTITSFWRYQLAGLAALLHHLADKAVGPRGAT